MIIVNGSCSEQHPECLETLSEEKITQKTPRVTKREEHALNNFTDEEKWIKAADVVDRMFLIVWILVYLSSIGLLMAMEINQVWDNLYKFPNK